MTFVKNNQFLENCRKSSQDAYAAFKELLFLFENPATRQSALTFWHELSTHLKQKHTSAEMMQLFHFSLSEVAFRPEEGEVTQLQLLQLPSTFAPEEWSFTFFEGLARFKRSEFQDKTVIELGCGIGWVTLALALQTRPSKIYGLDINPKAVLCSKINLFVNSFDPNGRPRWESEGKSLFDLVEFHTSDLLEYCRGQKIHVDRIIGCIPQVLNPDPEFALKVVAKRGLEQDNDEFLYSLSNYTAQQGYIEDEFGLGLIARAVEESVDVLRVSGKLILNLGGRPGEAVLRHLFLRRGFSVQPIWRTRVSQAKDTDIESLVAIEDQTPHRFEFYMGYGSDVPVSAKTALAYAEAGGEITHSLAVYEALIRDPAHLPQILQFMRQEGNQDARQTIDLSYSEDSLSIEKMSFLSALAGHLKEGNFFPYEKTAGLEQFRNRLASFFRRYFKIPLDLKNFLVLPSRSATCRNILNCFKPKTYLLDSQLARILGPMPGALEVPRSSDLICELMEKLCPEVVICSISKTETETRESFLRICDVSKRCNSRVFIDVSDLIDLSSTPGSNSIFRYLSQNRLPQNVNLICGLVKNRLYRDLEVCFLISESLDLLNALENAAELTYSRTPVLSQLFYDRILQELLNFQIIELSSQQSSQRNLPFPENEDFEQKYVSLSPPVKTAFTHPAISGESIARQPGLIRLDYGENCLPSPKILKRALFESYAKMHLTAEESDPTPEILRVAQSRFGFRMEERNEVILGSGVAPIFAGIASQCAQAGHTLIFPAGSYGHFSAAAEFHGAKIISVPTQLSHQFKLDGNILEQTLQRTSGHPWLILTAPVVNPTGAVYSVEELENIFRIAEKRGIVVVLDSIFSGLEFSGRSENLRHTISKFPSLRWMILGGISKDFAAGGLRLGYGISSDQEILSFWKAHSLNSLRPHSTLTFTLKKVYRHWLDQDPELMAELTQQKQELKRRAEVLSNQLKQIGWEPLNPSGGLFLCATPIDSSSIDTAADRLREKTGIVINPPNWTGIPGYFRFVLSTTQSQFDEALERLRKA